MKTALKWLVCIDGSEPSEAAFNYCITVAGKDDDVTLLAVSEQIHTQLYAHAYVSVDFIIDAQHKLDDASKALLRKHAKTAHEAGVKNVHLLLATSDHPGDSIVTAAKEKKIDTIVIGRRGMGALKRLFLGSVSRYVVENAPCDVVVIKGNYGPAVQHDASKEAVKQAEEAERQRRVTEEQAIDKTAQFNSALDRNVARLAEEEERNRRIREFQERHAREQKEREARLQEVKRLEEEERKERVAKDPEAHPPNFPFPEVHFAYMHAGEQIKKENV